MLALDNRTPFAAAIVPGLDVDGRDTATIVVKGTFRLAAQHHGRPASGALSHGRPASGALGAALAPADEQVPLAHADVFYGEPGRSSVRYEADTGPEKSGTDVVLVGHAVSPRAVTTLDVSLSVGPLRKTVRVFGDRAWFALLGRAAISEPLPFTRMPLVYERAFGGADLGESDEAKRARDPRNPIGPGFTSAAAPGDVAGVRLPNLEDPDHLVSDPTDRPPVAGFGFVARDWLPRRSYAGTYDEAWARERLPFLPLDFDKRYFQGAPPSLVATRPLRGGEPVRAAHVTEPGELAFAVPARALEIAVSLKRETLERAPVLDTLVIEPDERRVVAVWRATVPCPRAFLYIRRVRVREGAAA